MKRKMLRTQVIERVAELAMKLGGRHLPTMARRAAGTISPSDN
jgi:hypothetical protein